MKTNDCAMSTLRTHSLFSADKMNCVSTISVFLTFLLSSQTHTASGFEKSFERMGLGQEDTFQPNFQSNFLGNNPSVSISELEKTFASDLNNINPNHYSKAYVHSPTQYNANRGTNYPASTEFQFGKDYPDSLPGYRMNSNENTHSVITTSYNNYPKKMKNHYEDSTTIMNNYGTHSSQVGFSSEPTEHGHGADGATKAINGLEHSPLTEVTAVAGGRAVLPCDIKPSLPGDSTNIVLFYHGAVGTPVYSLDARDGTVGDHWHDKDTLGTRARFEMDLRPPGLVIEPVFPSDHNLYRCRVDFKSSPTRNSRVKLNVIEPPDKIIILNERGLEATEIIGPYSIGTKVKLRCDVHGGHPKPTVSWWQGNDLLDETSEEQGGDLTTNILHLKELRRSDLYKTLTCRGSNSNLTAPVAASVKVDINFPPEVVTLTGLKDPLIENSKRVLMCEARGSRPRAVLTWWKDGIRIPSVDDQMFRDGNISRSRVELKANVEDQGKSLVCKAENGQVPDAVMQDSKVIQIHFEPRLILSAGHNLNMKNIKEGADAYFECNIKANPKVFRVQWRHGNTLLHHNVSAGIILSNQSLVLQKVSRSSSGEYSCSATNQKGTGKSKPVKLSVKYAPVCQDTQQTVYGGGKNEHLNVTCAVHAHPAPKNFRWAFNSSSEINDIEHKRYRVVGDGISQVWYTPRSHLDYGSLLCWATNDVGTQEQPCVFHIIHASVPEPVHNCTVSNISRTLANVRCHAGWDGGLPQTFTLSVSQGERSVTREGYNGTNKGAPRVLANTSSSPKPQFEVSGLEAGKEYVLTISAVNSRGHSEPVSMAIETHQDKAQKRTSPGADAKSYAPLLAVILGTISVLLIMCVGVVVFVRYRRSASPNDVKMTVYPMEKSTSTPTLHSVDNHETTEVNSTEERSPDLIPEDQPEFLHERDLSDSAIYPMATRKDKSNLHSDIAHLRDQTYLQNTEPILDDENTQFRSLSRRPNTDANPYFYNTDQSILRNLPQVKSPDYHFSTLPRKPLISSPSNLLYSESTHPTLIFPQNPSLLPERSSFSPPPLPTCPSTPYSAYNSLPRGGRSTYTSSSISKGIKDLETKPYPSTSTAFSTIVRTAPNNLSNVSTRGIDASTRESSV